MKLEKLFKKVAKFFNMDRDEQKKDRKKSQLKKELAILIEIKDRIK